MCVERADRWRIEDEKGEDKRDKDKRVRKI